MKIQNKQNIILEYSPNIKVIVTLCTLLLSLVVNGQTLQEYLKEAEQNNPELKAIHYNYEASIEKINEATDLPNTTFGAGYFISEPETRTGAQKARFSVQQKLPWFGTLKSRKEEATAMSVVDKNKLEITKRKIFLKIEKTYYKLYELNAKQKVLTEQEKLLDTYKEIALIELENNRASVVDVLKLNIAKNNLQNQQEIVKGAILTEESALNQLLHRDGFDALLVPDNLAIPDEEPTMVLDDITYHPELITYDYLNEVMDKKLVTNTKEGLPSVGLGLDYVIVQERTDVNILENGKDIIMPMLSVSVPIFSKKYKSRSKQYKFQKEGLIQKREAAQNDLENLMEEAINNRITARINYDTQQKNIEQAREVEKILRAGYQTARLDFQELLDVQQMIFSFENKKINAIATYFTNTAILNYLR